MDHKLSIATLLKYQKGHLTSAETVKVHAVILANPHYRKVLLGLGNLKEILKEEEEEKVLDFMEKKKALLKEKIFGQTGR